MELHVSLVGAEVNARSVAVENVLGDGLDSLDVVASELGSLSRESINCGGNCLHVLLVNLINQLLELVSAIGELLDLLLDILGVLLSPLLELEDAAASSEAFLRETGDTSAVSEVALDSTVLVALLVHLKVLGDLTEVLNNGSNGLTEVHDDLSLSVLVSVSESLDNLLGLNLSVLAELGTELGNLLTNLSQMVLVDSDGESVVLRKSAERNSLTILVHRFAGQCAEIQNIIAVLLGDG